MSPEQPIDMGPDEEPIPPLPSPLLPEIITVYALAYCKYADGHEDGPYTITVDMGSDWSAADLQMALQARADMLCIMGTVGLSPGGGVSARYIITAPTFFQYSTGI